MDKYHRLKKTVDLRWNTNLYLSNIEINKIYEVVKWNKNYFFPTLRKIRKVWRSHVKIESGENIYQTYNLIGMAFPNVSVWIAFLPNVSVINGIWLMSILGFSPFLKSKLIKINQNMYCIADAWIYMFWF